MTTPTEREALLLKEMRHIAGISNGQVKRVADAVLAQCGQQTVAPIIRATEREALIAVLRGGRQCDEDGEEIIMSRQACCVAADMLEADAQRMAMPEEWKTGSGEPNKPAQQVAVPQPIAEPVSREWKTTAPTESGKYLCKSADTDFEVREHRVYWSRGLLFVESDAGNYYVHWFHNNLNSPQWAKIEHELAAPQPPQVAVPQGFEATDDGKYIRTLRIPIAPQPPQQSSISAEVLAFLNGAGPLDGMWFGEDHPTERGKFWWRKHLSAAPQPEARKPLTDDEISDAISRDADEQFAKDPAGFIRRFTRAIEAAHGIGAKP